jgi:prenyltransferase beta subunit
VKHRLLLPLCLLALVSPARAQTADQKKATVAYLHKLQTRGGAFRASAKADRPTLRATSACLRAIRYFGGEVENKAACGEFVRRCFDRETGGFADTPGGKPDVVVTAVGLMAVVELKLPRADYEKPAIRYLALHAKGFEQVRMAAAGLEAVGRRSAKNGDWLKQLARDQNDDGTFGEGDAKARETGGAVACVLRLGGKVKDREAVLKALDAGQRGDGGFGKAGAKGSDLETTYRVMRTYHMLGAKPGKADAVRKFIARCRNADGGYGVTPGEPSTAGGTYFAGIVLHWLDAK